MQMLTLRYAVLRAVRSFTQNKHQLLTRITVRENAPEPMTRVSTPRPLEEFFNKTAAVPPLYYLPRTGKRELKGEVLA